MNIFRRIYCRTFQIAFRAAIPVLPYRKPHILDGIADRLALIRE